MWLLLLLVLLCCSDSERVQRRGVGVGVDENTIGRCGHWGVVVVVRRFEWSGDRRRALRWSAERAVKRVDVLVDARPRLERLALCSTR